MDHVVFHPGPDGAPGFHRFSSLDEAVQYVEHLRNAEGVVDVSVHALMPVPLAFRAYYKVEVPAVDVADLPMVPEQPVAAVAASEPFVDGAFADEMAPVEAADADDAGGSGDKRTLGFFAH